MNNGIVLERVMKMLNGFKGKDCGEGTVSIGDVEYVINMFRKDGLMILAGANKFSNTLPEVFGVSDAKRLLIDSKPGISYAINGEARSKKPLLERSVATFNNVKTEISARLQNLAEKLCSDYVRAQYGDAELMPNCECEENQDAAVAASYWCTQILATTGSFENLNNYMQTNVDNELVQDKKPVYTPPSKFNNNVSQAEAIEFFFNGEQALNGIAQARFERYRDIMVNRYCEHCLHIVKWYKGIKTITDDDNSESFKAAIAINKAIKEFLADEKYGTASKLTYTVHDVDGRKYMFRLPKRRLMLANSLPSDYFERVPHQRVPGWYALQHMGPEHIDEIRYVKHIVYKK